MMLMVGMQKCQMLYELLKKVRNYGTKYSKMGQQTTVDWIVDQMLSEGHKEMWKDMIQQAKQMEKEQSQTEISDEEIEKFASDFYDNNGADEFIMMGAKWYREQLKNGVHGT